MRSFFIACSILLVICVLILFNTFYVTNKTSELDSICEELALTGSEESLTKLICEWEKSRFPLTLSVKHGEADRAENALCLLSEYLRSGNAADFRAELSLFRSALRHIADSQRFSGDNIF